MAKTREAPESLDAFISGLTDRTLACRELGHTWRPNTVTWEADSGTYHRTMRCPGCRTVRVQVLTRTGHVVSNGYRYPDGYLAAGLGAGNSRDAFRAEAVQRFLETHSGHEAA